MDDTTSRKPMDDDASEGARSHMRAARQEWRESMASLFPPEFVDHQRNARREMLLAWRSFIDHAIQRLDEREAEKKA